MLKSKNGRTWSERSPDEAVDLLQEELNKFTPQEREVLQLIIREMGDPAIRPPQAALEGGGPVGIYDAMREMEYKRIPVDIETFVQDDYYLGESCKTLYPKYLQDLKEIIAGGYQEAIFTGSIGSGKSFSASILICYVLYQLSCLRDVHATLKLGKGSDISIAGISVNEQLAIRVVYENIAVKIAQSPYFKEEFKFEETKKELRFPNNIQVVALSTTDTAALGLNILALFMDEGNFYEAIQRGRAAQMKYGDRDKARVLYDQMTRRMKSRFLGKGKIPSISCLVSSKRTKDDFISKRISESTKDPYLYVMDYNLWGLIPERFNKERFHVLVGNETMPSKIIPPSELDIMKSKIIDGNDDSLFIVDVPTDFITDFENDVDGSLRDIAGIETVSISPFIQQRDKLDLCIDKTRQHPFQVEEWDQSKLGTWIWEKLASQQMIRDGAEVFKQWLPIYYPDRPRHIHIDLSLNTDCTGICCGCTIGFKQTERTNLETREKYIEASPVIWVDFMLRIKPPVGGEIDHGEVRGLVYQLQSHGFHISLLTMDQANSASSLQKFQAKGITTDRLSVDRPMDPYDTLKSAIYEGRVQMYKYEPVLDELRKLQIDRMKGKVDHQRNSKKDLADALCGVVYSLTTRARSAPGLIMKGISQHIDPELESDTKALESNASSEFFPRILF